MIRGDDAFGPYVAPAAPSNATRSLESPLLHAAVAGAGGGAITAGLGGVPYWLAYSQDADISLAWREVGVVFLVFIVSTGALVCLAQRAGVSLFDRYLGTGRIGSALAGFAGAALFGTVAGVVPGSFGTAYFGGQHAPFMGTAMLALAPAAGALVASTWIAVTDRRSSGFEVSTARVLGLALVATAAFGGVGAVLCAFVDDATMLHAFVSGAAALSADATSPEGLARVGAIAGAILGLSVGSHIGATLALARLVFPRR